MLKKIPDKATRKVVGGLSAPSKPAAAKVESKKIRAKA